MDDAEGNDVSNSSGTRQDYSEDTFNEISNGSIHDGTDNGNGKTENSNEISVKESARSEEIQQVEVPNNTKKTPLLVEILRRLPKTTDSTSNESSSNKSVNETTGEVNNETFVTASRSASNQLSESF